MRRTRANLSSETILELSKDGMPVGCRVSAIEWKYSCGVPGCDVTVRITVCVQAESPDSIAWQTSIKQRIRRLFSDDGYSAHVAIESQAPADPPSA